MILFKTEENYNGVPVYKDAVDVFEELSEYEIVECLFKSEKNISLIIALIEATETAKE